MTELPRACSIEILTFKATWHEPPCEYDLATLCAGGIIQLNDSWHQKIDYVGERFLTHFGSALGSVEWSMLYMWRTLPLATDQFIFDSLTPERYLLSPGLIACIRASVAHEKLANNTAHFAYSRSLRTGEVTPVMWGVSKDFAYGKPETFGIDALDPDILKGPLHRRPVWGPNRYFYSY